MLFNSPTIKSIVFFKYILSFLTLVVISLVLFSAFIAISNVNHYYKASFDGMINGTAYKPFVTRVLIPWLTIGTKALLSTTNIEMINGWIAQSPTLLSLLSIYNVSSEVGVQALISLIWQYISLLGFYIVFLSLSQKLFLWSGKNLLFIILVVSFGLLPLFREGYIYDLPELFLSTAAFLTIISKRALLYLLVFSLSILNKESSVVLVIPSIFLFWDFDNPRIINVTNGFLLQLVIFLVIRIPLLVKFRNNPGGLMENHFLDHIHYISKDPFSSIVSILIFLCVGILLFYNWKQKPLLLSLGALAGFVLFGLFLVGGYPMEFRVFYEVYGVLIISTYGSFLMFRKHPLSIVSCSTEEFIQSFQSAIKGLN